MTSSQPAPPQQSYDRVVSQQLMEALMGPLASVLTWREADLGLRDLQLRRGPKSSRTWCSLYVGLTSVLNIEENGSDRFRLTAHKTHRDAGGFDPAWGAWQPLSSLTDNWQSVDGYLSRVVPLVDDRWTDSEGQVHALLANSPHLGAAIINREASHSFVDEAVRAQRKESWAQPLRDALRGVPAPGAWWASTTKIAFGHSPDFIAVDEHGRLLVIEAKPPNATAGLSLAPAQVAHYAAMYAHWLQEQPSAVGSLAAELAQRQQLGLLPKSARTKLLEPVQVVPVIAIGPGPVSPAAWQRLSTVAHALVGTTTEAVEPLAVWVLNEAGAPTPWAWWGADDELPVTSDQPVARLNYRQRARLAAQRWKEDVLGLVEDGAYPATSASLYPFVLPVAHAAANLLPGIEGATALLASKNIQWHRGVSGGPTNHLLSSQVQCVNALYPATHDPQRLTAAFSDVLDIAGTLAVEDDRYVTFEYVGPADLLNEGPSMRRGAGRTSADAAFLYRTSSDRRELALVEWKYTESYSATGLSGNDGVRRARYRQLWEDPAGPIRSAEAGDGTLSLDDVLVEPFYQLVRQQLLAWKLEQSGAADVVRVVHVGPAGNTAYQRSVPTPALRALGSTVAEVWGELLRPAFSDRFLWTDSSRFLDPEVTSAAYCARYDHR